MGIREWIINLFGKDIPAEFDQIALENRELDVRLTKLEKEDKHGRK